MTEATPVSDEVLAQIEAALAKTTPGPWEAMEFNPEYPGDGVSIIGLRLDDSGRPMHTPTNGLVAAACLFPTEIDNLDAARAEADAAAIVLLRNETPALLARLRASEQQRDEAAEKLRAETAAREAAEARVRELEAGLRPFVEGASHTRIFLASRQRIHPCGLAIFDEDIERGSRALSGED